MTADCKDKDIKKQFRRQNAVGNMLVWKFSFAPIEEKKTVQVILLPHLWMCSLVSFISEHINVVFHKFAYWLMSRVIASPNSVVTGIDNSDAYHQFPLMDKWASMLYV